MAMQYLSGSKGISIPSGVEIELVYDTCSMHQYVYPNIGLCAEQRDLVAKTIGRGFAICSKKED